MVRLVVILEVSPNVSLRCFLCLSRERREAERKLEDLKKNRSIALGRQKGFEEEILHYR